MRNQAAIFDDDITGQGTRSNGYYATDIQNLNEITEILGPGRLSRCSMLTVEVNKKAATVGVLTIYRATTQDFSDEVAVGSIDIAGPQNSINFEGAMGFLRGKVTLAFDSGVHVYARGLR